MSLPHRLGRLRRISRIGSGGFATVWLYSDPDLQSSVAVKALADNWAARSDIRDRFLEEARILRRADHDHIVRVYDLGETDDGTPYFVMNYADRGTVAELLNAPSRDLQLIADLVGQAGRGLQRLHSMGILHRDVKPQNLLLRDDPSGETRLMVADLGVAKATLHASGITQVVGTPAYMAPEQADPTRGVDNRCDVHALGAVAYHLVTGQPVRTGSVESLFVPEPIRPPTMLVADLPQALDHVLLRAVAYDPAQRWPDVESFGAAFVDATLQTRTRMFAPPQIEPQVWQPDLPSPVSTSPSPTPQQGTPQQGMSPVISDPSPASPITGSGPPPLSPVPPPANGSSRSSARRSWLAALAALVVVALVLGGVLLLQELRQDDSPAAPDPGLGSGWSDGEKVGSTWKYTNDDQKLALAVNRSITEGESVADAATEHVDSEQMDDYKVEVDRELSDEQRGKWESGWQLQYARTGGSGDCDYFWRWYFGNNAPATAGWVEICGADKADIKNNDDAVEILAQVRDELMVGEE
ncbi:MAG TPA: serine/threonine-protein kinase [Nocardioidaceae bacterium]|nr:serine/threonine-protein kinase [Nocardioidaceae bacterium]